MTTSVFLFAALMSNKLLLDKVPICVPVFITLRLGFGPCYISKSFDVDALLTTGGISLSRFENSLSSCPTNYVRCARSWSCYKAS